MNNKIDHMIKLDGEQAKELGFTSDKFRGWLWQDDNTIIISFIHSMNQRQGHFGELCKTILAKGYAIEVPTPSSRMREILIKNGYTETVKPFYEDGIQIDVVETWRKEPDSVSDIEGV